MALPDLDAAVGHSFGLEFDGVVIKNITAVSGLKIDQEVIEFEQDPSSGRLIVRRLPGRPRASEVTLTRGLTGDDSFEQWLRRSRFGAMSDVRRGGAIIVYDFEGAPVRRYELINARLKSAEPGTPRAGETSYLTERLILTHEGSRAE